MFIKSLTKSILNRMGIGIHRFNVSPKNTFLGLRTIPFGTVIDVGANRGQFVREASKKFPYASFYCFEPLPEPFKELSSWAERQNKEVNCYNVALAEEEGESKFYFHEEHSPSSSFLLATDTCHKLFPQTKAEKQISVRVSTLDKEIGPNIKNLKGEIMLKIDVQGLEDRVLRGGASVVLPNCRAVMLEVCLAGLYADQADFSSLVYLMRENGLFYAGNYQQAYGDDGRVLYVDAIFIRDL